MPSPQEKLKNSAIKQRPEVASPQVSYEEEKGEMVNRTYTIEGIMEFPDLTFEYPFGCFYSDGEKVGRKLTLLQSRVMDILLQFSQKALPYRTVHAAMYPEEVYHPNKPEDRLFSNLYGLRKKLREIGPELAEPLEVIRFFGLIWNSPAVLLDPENKETKPTTKIMPPEREKSPIEVRLSELEARLGLVETGLLRLSGRDFTSTPLFNLNIKEYPGLVYDFSSGEFRSDGGVIKLSRIQSRLVERLIKANGSVVLYQELHAAVYPDERCENGYFENQRLRTVAFSARARLKEVFPKLPKCLQTVRGRGMRWASLRQEKEE